jgi:excisionase family DNA binding protein
MSGRRWPGGRAADHRTDPGGRGHTPDLRREDLADPWMTVGEIATELRVHPATVRLWISKGTLPATRAGQRKLLIRRSDLDRTLEATSSQPPVLGCPSRAMPRLSLPFIEFVLSEPETSEEALRAELDALFAHVREAVLAYSRARRAINAQEHRES